MTMLVGLGLVAVLLLVVIGIYNGLVSRRQNCNQGMADIDAQLRQRHDLIPNLVSTVQGYAAHEKATLDAVISARGATLTAQSGAAATSAENALSGALGKLFAIAEAYPDLKANANFQSLQNELADVEDKLAASRRAYNAAAADYNGAIEAFPAVLVARSLGFPPRAFWEIDSGERALVSAVPEAKF